VRAVNITDLAEQRSVALIHDHDAILAGNEYTVPRRVGMT